MRRLIRDIKMIITGSWRKKLLRLVRIRRSMQIRKFKEGNLLSNRASQIGK